MKVLQWTLTSLAPSLGWEISMSMLKLNVKRAPLISMFIVLSLEIIQKVEIENYLNLHNMTMPIGFVIFRYLKGPFTFPAFLFRILHCLGSESLLPLTLTSPPTSVWHSPTLMASNSDFWFQSHSWWTDFDFISLILLLPQCVHHLYPFESSLAPSNGSHHRTGTLWTTADCPLGQNYSAFPN